MAHDTDGFKKSSKNKPISKMGYTRWAKARKAQKASSAYKGVGGRMSAGKSASVRPVDVEKPIKKIEPITRGSFYKDEFIPPSEKPSQPKYKLGKPKKQFFVARGGMARPKYKRITRGY